MQVENDVEMSASENQIVVYHPNETVRLDVRLENETAWLTQRKIAELFSVQKAAISKHVKNIFASGELIKEATVSKMETVHAEGGCQPPYLLCRPMGAEIISGLLDSIRKAMTEHREDIVPPILRG